MRRNCHRRISLKLPIYQSSGRGSCDKKIKEENRSIDFEEKTLSPPDVSLVATADRATKHYTQGDNKSVKNIQTFVQETTRDLEKREIENDGGKEDND